MKYFLNGEDQGIATDDINFDGKSYYLAITFDEIADVKLLDFLAL